MCGVAVGPIDIERIIYYSFFSENGLTLDRGGLQAFIMFLNARFYMYTNVYYHRTTRGIDLHLKEIFRHTMTIAFPFDLGKDPHPLNPLKMGDRQIYVYDSATKTVSMEPLTEILKYLPGKVAQCRIFATTHEHDAVLAAALKRALDEEPSAIVTNV